MERDQTLTDSDMGTEQSEESGWGKPEVEDTDSTDVDADDADGDAGDAGPDTDTTDPS